MKGKTTCMVLLLAGVLFAGCASQVEEVPSETSERARISTGKGAIAGLLIDDIYRPIPDTLVLLQGTGLTTTTDASGQFTFLDIDPGSYILVASSPAHEAAPANVDVRMGEYAEAELQARRIFSNDGYIITTSYSIFTACASSAVLVATVYSCLADSDSYRPGLHMNNFTEKDITYLVAEVLLNQADQYTWVLRCSGGGSFGCGEYAYVNITTKDETSKGVYGKVVLKLGENYMNTWQSHVWNNTDPIDMLVFYQGTGGDEVTDVAKPVGCMLPPVTNPLNGKPAFCRVYYGAGHRFAVQGKIILSLFLGEPKESIDDYHVLSPP
jgi:hypothetical protein